MKNDIIINKNDISEYNCTILVFDKPNAFNVPRLFLFESKCEITLFVVKIIIAMHENKTSIVVKI